MTLPSDPEKRDAYLKGMSDRAKARYEDPEYKKQHDEIARDLAKDPEWQRKQKAGCQKRSPEHCKNLSVAAIKRFENPEYKKRHDEMVRALTLDPEWHNKLSKSLKKKFKEDPIYRRKHDDAARTLAKDPDWREKQKAGCQNRSPEWCKNMSVTIKKKHKEDPEYRKRVSAGLQGIPLEEWKCFTHYAPYCEKFNNEFKERVRAFQGYRCALCGHIWKPDEVKLTVHHVHNQKDSCCNQDAPVVFVCLCSRGCHHRTIKNWRKYVQRFMRYLLKNFNGKSYYTKEEMEKYYYQQKVGILGYTLEEGFKGGIWSREGYEREVMYPEVVTETS